MAELLKVDVKEWKKELEDIREHYRKFGSRLPSALNDELAALEKRLG
jgi:phosphoenolpyruvate carboxykinase (GTP)